MHLHHLMSLIAMGLTIWHNLALMCIMTMGPLRQAAYCDMARTKINTGDQPRLNDRETTTLQSHVEDWVKASGTERRQIFKAAAREAKLLAPKMDKGLLKQRKEKYRQWFHNHKKHKADAKAPMKLQKKWMACRVIEEEWKANILQQIHDEIEEETGQKPGQKEVLRRYQPTMTAIIKGLDNNELEEARAKADEWTNQAPDATVQAKTAKKKGKKMIKHFAKEMFTQAGMRVFVLGSWKDEKGGLLTSGRVYTVGQFDFNEQLGTGSSFMKYKDWQVILPAWEDFIGDAFGASFNPFLHQDQDQDQDSMLLGGTRRVPKPSYEFDLDHMGLPMLPHMEGFSLDAKKGIIRSFLTIHYRICCAKLKVPVPWSDIMKGQSRFISGTYLPDGTKIMDPSKMHRDEANSLLECWLDRQDNQVGLTFKFKAWIDDKGKMHPPVGEEADDSDSDADDEGMRPRPTKKSSATAALSQAGIPKARPRSIRRAYISSADEESNNTDADVSLPKVKKCAPNRVGKGTNAKCSDQVGRQSESDNRLPPKSLRKRVRVEPAIISTETDSVPEDRPIVDLVRKVSCHRKPSAVGRTGMLTAQVTEGSEDESHGRTATKAGHQSTQAHHAGQQARGFGPHSTRRGLEHLRASPPVQDQRPIAEEDPGYQTGGSLAL
ncbi:hypothetical protein F4604DRAFT_1686626 [Suillus subluteus]|nr:hypothetical protein F4604DRAFT_1686626 [Suillus subluteus]